MDANYHAIFAGVVTVTALSMFINERYIKMPKTIALTIISIAISIVLTYLIQYTPNLIKPIHQILSGVDFKTTVLDVMLGYLLFASSLHINTIALKKQFSIIFYLASAGVVTSTIFTAFLLWKFCEFIHFNLTFADCLIFGALISPTDPIAVASVFQTTKNISETIKTRITGESLFNDAAGILLLVILIRIFYHGDTEHLSISSISLMVIKEALGGVLWGLIVGSITAIFIKRTTDTEIGILLTVAAASSGYILAHQLHVSGAITMVIAGLIVGNYTKKLTTKDEKSFDINQFWDLIDGILNALLFVLIGLEMMTINVNFTTMIIGIIGIIIVFFARFGSMLFPSTIFYFYNKHKYPFHWIEIILLCWGGIRGAISIALALSINHFPPSLIAITYFIVIFSILFQGSSFKWIINKTAKYNIDASQ